MPLDRIIERVLFGSRWLLCLLYVGLALLLIALAVQFFRELFHIAAHLFELRIALAGVVHDAASLEVQTGGGRGYLRGLSGVARRQREAAFVPIVTPSLVQLKNQLAAQRTQQRPTGTAP